MTHVVYQDVDPFDFQGLQIRELTPAGWHYASVAEVEVAPGAGHETARSVRSDKLYICAAGTASFRVEDQEQTLETGDVLLIRKNEWFDYHNDTSDVVRLILVHIPPFDMASEQFHTPE